MRVGVDGIGDVGVRALIKSYPDVGVGNPEVCWSLVGGGVTCSLEIAADECELLSGSIGEVGSLWAM